MSRVAIETKSESAAKAVAIRVICDQKKRANDFKETACRLIQEYLVACGVDQWISNLPGVALVNGECHFKITLGEMTAKGTDPPYWIKVVRLHPDSRSVCLTVGVLEKGKGALTAHLFPPKGIQAIDLLQQIRSVPEVKPVAKPSNIVPINGVSPQAVLVLAEPVDQNADDLESHDFPVVSEDVDLVNILLMEVARQGSVANEDLDNFVASLTGSDNLSPFFSLVEAGYLNRHLPSDAWVLSLSGSERIKDLVPDVSKAEESSVVHNVSSAPTSLPESTLETKLRALRADALRFEELTAEIDRLKRKLQEDQAELNREKEEFLATWQCSYDETVGAAGLKISSCEEEIVAHSLDKAADKVRQIAEMLG
jgi:hypothetical protein